MLISPNGHFDYIVINIFNMYWGEWMEVWHYYLFAVLGLIVYISVRVYERLKAIEAKIDSFIYNHEKDNLPDKLNCLINSSIDIEDKINKLDRR